MVEVWVLQVLDLHSGCLYSVNTLGSIHDLQVDVSVKINFKLTEETLNFYSDVS